MARDPGSDGVVVAEGHGPLIRALFWLKMGWGKGRLSVCSWCSVAVLS